MAVSDSNSILSAFQQFGKQTKAAGFNRASNMVVKYTRVSSKEQADTNCSLQSQDSSINEFTARQKLEIIASFGGTYESAKTDGRKEFQRMLQFIKKYNTARKKEEDKIVAIVVWHFSRFSRTGGKAIALADELREKYGVHILTVCNPLDTSNSHGIMMQDMQLVFSRWDNETRKENVVSGMKRRLINGGWIGRVPLGYDYVKSNGEEKVVVNKQGKLIHKAFEWKADGIANIEIIDRLKSHGLTLSRQALSKMLVNPFYTGLLSHRLLEGKVVEGKQEKAVSRELFLKVNKLIQEGSGYGIVHQREDETTPMRGFMKCSACNQPMTGYLVKKKWRNGKAKERKVFPAYYKCRTIGCKNNIAAKKIHADFEEVLKYISVLPEKMPGLLHIMEKRYFENTKEQQQRSAHLHAELKELEKNINTLERKFYVTEEISRDIFEKFHAQLLKDRQEVHKKLEAEKILSNPLESFKRTLEICSKLPEIWGCGKYEVKERLQKVLFPEGIHFDKENQVFRTPRLNSVFGWIVHLSKGSDTNNNANLPQIGKLATFAEREVNEPPLIIP